MLFNLPASPFRLMQQNDFKKKPAPRIGEVWTFADPDERGLGPFSTGLLAYVNENLIAWRGVAGCLVVLERKYLLEKHRNDCPCCKARRDLLKDKQQPPNLSWALKHYSSIEEPSFRHQPYPSLCYGCREMPPLEGKSLCQRCLDL